MWHEPKNGKSTAVIRLELRISIRNPKTSYDIFIIRKHTSENEDEKGEETH
jgi:hypothetical protein